ncbi:bifunctional phosphoglucose/phosphomannose isomerase [Candidatus Bathyarchaeota archaeon]|nr:MAG: bifunctional phosphoglucose/phosphomannose isomerase [Candidatus Bathyarchaeota archaeon]
MHETTILDIPEELEKIDKSNMLNLCVKTPEYCQDAIQRAKKIKIPNEVKVSKKITIKYKKPQNIIITGMGGSAIGGEILQDWLQDKLPIPIQICRNYTLPAYANRNTLVFAISYSGETAETLSAFIDAIRRKCMTITISSGGHLLSFSKKLQIPHVTIPNGRPPRAAIPYIFFPLPILLEKMDILSNIEKDIEEAIRVLKKVSEENSPYIPTKKNMSKTLALELKETIPVVYGFGQSRAVAHRMKTQFNENSKLLSVYDVFPELNHNEAVGWEVSEDLAKKFSVILIRDHNEPPEIKHRIEMTKMLALHKAQKVLEIYARGKGGLAKMFSVLLVGDFVSVFLAILQGVDPAPVKTIDLIKREMNRKFDVAGKLEEEIRKMIE